MTIIRAIPFDDVKPINDLSHIMWVRIPILKQKLLKLGEIFTVKSWRVEADFAIIFQ